MSYTPEEMSPLSDTELWDLVTKDENLQKVWALVELGGRSYDKRDAQNAVSLATQAAETAVTLGSALEAGRAYVCAAKSHALANEYEEAVATLHTAIEHFQTAGDQIAIADSYLWIAKYALDDDEYDVALQASLDALSFATQENAHRMMGWAHYYEGKALYFLDCETESLTSLQESREMFRSHGALEQVAMVDDYAATVHSYLGNYEQAAELLRQCLHVAEATKDTDDDAYARRRLGSALRLIGRDEDAIGLLQRALVGYRESDRTSQLPLCEREIAECHDSLKDFGNNPSQRMDYATAALQGFERAQSLYDALGDDGNVRHCKMRRSQILHEIGRYTDSERLTRQLFNEVLPIPDDVGYGYVHWVGLHQAGNLLKMERFQEVLDLTESLDDKRAEPTQAALAWKHTMRARSLAQLGDADAALHEVESGLAATDDDNLDAETAYLYQIKAEILLARGSKSGERDLAHAIAIHLASGETGIARDLAQHFIPKFSKGDTGGLGTVGAEMDMPDDHPGGYPIGFVPS